jgi:hypothetical protein
VTSIQKFLGHKKLNTTMIYARAHDQTVEGDYFAAMSRIEQRLALSPEPVEPPVPLSESERGMLRVLAEQLFVPELGYEKRVEIAVQMCDLLGGSDGVQMDWIPPPVPVLANTETA